MAGPERVRVVHDFDKPVARVFAYLAEHENLALVFGGVRIQRLRDGSDGTRNGVGSTRRLRIGPMPWFEETVTRYVPDALIAYRITRGTPLRDHWGQMTFEPRASGGCRLVYTIGMNAIAPGIAPLVGRALAVAIRRGLPLVDARA